MKRIFYSWQKDLPSRSNRGFIETALEAAVAGAAGNGALSEAAIDSDTVGVPGAPNIASTIFDKIAQSDAYIADVSIIGNAGARPTPNPNVLVELGFALRALGESRVILVLNAHFGAVEQLPFDLRQLRTLVYVCDPDDADKASKRRPFAQSLQSALSAVLSQLPTHRYPDVRVQVSRGLLIPGVREEKTPVVSMTVENHSNAPLYLSSIGLQLPEGGEARGLWLTRDVFGQPNSGGKVEPGDRYQFMFDEREFAKGLDEHQPLSVEAFDRIGRVFRSNEAEFASLLGELRKDYPASER